MAQLSLHFDMHMRGLAKNGTLPDSTNSSAGLHVEEMSQQTRNSLNKLGTS